MISERTITTDDYQSAVEVLQKVRQKIADGKELSGKDDAILVFAADASVAHQQVQLYTQTMFERNALVGPEFESAELYDRVTQFGRRLHNGLVAARDHNLLIGEVEYAAAILADFEAVFAGRFA